MQSQLRTIEDITARRIHCPENLDPLRLIKTFEDILSIPSIVCNLQTSRGNDVDEGNLAFVVVQLKNGNEGHYVMYLQRGEKKEGRTVIGFDPLTVWDSEAVLVQHPD